jgi:hypothetical protein
VQVRRDEERKVKKKKETAHAHMCECNCDWMDALSHEIFARSAVVESRLYRVFFCERIGNEMGNEKRRVEST